MDAFDEDAEPFDLTDDLEEDADEEEYDDLEDATEDDVDLVVALYREDGQAVAVPLEMELANDLDELMEQLRRLPGDSGADGWVAIDGDVFVICRVRGRTVEVLLNDVTAALDWPIARDVVDYLGEDVTEDDDPAPVGDLEIYAASGLGAFEMEAIATDYETEAYDQLAAIARKLRVEDEFLAAADEFGG